mgnify:CR=1 FL=1
MKLWDDDKPRYDNCYRSDRNRRDEYRHDDWYNDYKRDDDRRNDYRRDKIVVNMIEIIRQEMIEMTGGHIKVTDIMMIEEGMTIIDMTIVNSMMTKGMIIDDPKDLDNFNIILKVEMMQTHMMFGSHSMKREKLVDRWCQIAIFAGKMVTMQISTQRRIKTKHRQLTWSLPKYNKLLPRVGLNNQNGRYRKKFPK